MIKEKLLAIPKNSVTLFQNTTPMNLTLDILKMSVKEDDLNFYLTKDSYYYIKEKYAEQNIIGVGTELKKILGKIGIHATPTCSCNHRARLMDLNGIAWCENNIETILVWLSEEAKNRKLPFIAYAAKLLIKKAIHNAKKLLKQNT